MKILLESKGPRRLSHDPMEFFAMNKIKNGWTVAVGYLMTPTETKLTYGPSTKKYNIAQNDAQLAALIEKYKGTPWAAKLDEIRQSPKYQAAMISGKSAPFDLGGCNIIKIGRYNFNWRDKEANARDWERRGNMELDIRRRYGFGKDESEYAENDWRRNPKYGGLGVRRVISSGKQGIAKYQGDHDTLYTHIDNNGKIAIRQQLAQRNGDQSKWYFIDEAGIMTEMPKEAIYFLRDAYKHVKTSDGVADLEKMEEDERNFKREIKELRDKNKHEIKQLLMERIIYMVATTVNNQGEHEPVAYVNDQTIYETYDYLNKTEMMKVITPWLRLSTTETMQMNERFKFRGSSKSLNEGRTMEEMDRAAMNELNGILFTPRFFAHGMQEINDTFYPEYPELRDWLVMVGFDYIMDEDNPDTVYVISDENPRPMKTKNFPNFVKSFDEFVTEYGVDEVSSGIPESMEAEYSDGGLNVIGIEKADGTTAWVIKDEFDGYTTYYTGMNNLVDIVAMMLDPEKIG